MNTVVKSTLFIFIGLIFFASCKKEYSCERNCVVAASDTVQVIVSKHPPVANAGIDQTIVLPADKTILDGTASVDADNNIASYAWTKISGPAMIIANATAIKTTISNLTQGTYQFELTVKDADGLFSKDTVLIKVTETSCDIGARQFVNMQIVEVGNLSVKREGVAIAAAGNKILFAGGSSQAGSSFSTVDIYDISNNKWTVANLSVPRFGITAAVAGNKILFAGGFDKNAASSHLDSYSTVDIYDVVTESWTVTQMSIAAGNRTAAVLNNKVFFAGGYQYSVADVELTSIVDIFDMQNNTLSTANLSDARYGIAAAVSNNNVYFAGGLNSKWESSNRVDIYNGTNGTWSQSILNQPAGNMAGIATGDNIFWAGGHTNSPERSLQSIEIKNTKTNTSKAECLFQRNEVFSAVTAKNKIIFFVGNSALTGAKNKFDIYDIATNTWSIGVISEGIQGASIISVNNTLYIAGGFVTGNLSTKVWKLDF